MCPLYSAAARLLLPRMERAMAYVTSPRLQRAAHSKNGRLKLAPVRVPRSESHGAPAMRHSSNSAPCEGSRGGIRNPSLKQRKHGKASNANTAS